MGTCARLSTPLLAGGLVVFIIASALYAADAASPGIDLSKVYGCRFRVNLQGYYIDRESKPYSFVAWRTPAIGGQVDANFSGKMLSYEFNDGWRDNLATPELKVNVTISDDATQISALAISQVEGVEHLIYNYNTISAGGIPFVEMKDGVIRFKVTGEQTCEKIHGFESFYDYERTDERFQRYRPATMQRHRCDPNSFISVELLTRQEDMALASVVVLKSIPKDQQHYTFKADFPQLLPKDKAPAVYKELYTKELGELEIIFSWFDTKDNPQKVSFKKTISALIPVADTHRARLRREGEMFLEEMTRSLEPPRTLVIGHKVLDQLEKITADPANARQKIGKGENILAGSELDFNWEIIFHHPKQGIVARAPGTTILKYLVRYPVVFIPGTAGSRLSPVGYRDILFDKDMWPANVWSGTRFPILDEINIRDWKALALDDDGRGREVKADRIFKYYGETFGISAASVYKKFLEHLPETGYEENSSFFLFPYDWRLSIDKHTGALEEMVGRVLDLNYNRLAADSNTAERPKYQRQKTDKVFLIGHSQGGLIARCCAMNAAAADKIRGIIMLGTPNLGSMKTFKALAGAGYNFETPFLHPEVGKLVARNWYSPYQMLPVTSRGDYEDFVFEEVRPADWWKPGASRAVTLNPVPMSAGWLKSIKTHTLCNNKIWRPGPEGTTCTLNAGRVDSALQFFRSFHSVLGNPVDKGVPVFIIASTGQPTITGFRITTMEVVVSKAYAAPDNSRGLIDVDSASNTVLHDDLQQAGYLPAQVIAQDRYAVVENGWTSFTVSLPCFEEIGAPCGDGTVALHSALDTEGLKGADIAIVSGVKHGGLTEDTAVQHYVDRILQSVLPADMSRAPKVACDSHPSAVANGVIITASHSPANIHLYDAQDRHTGLRKDGAQEEQIPGSVFENSGDTQRILLAGADEQLRLVLEGLVETQMSLTVTSGDGRRENTLHYANISEKPGMQASMVFDSSRLAADTRLEIDYDSDGKSDQTVAPAAVRTLGPDKSEIAIAAVAAGPAQPPEPAAAQPAEAPTTKPGRPVEPSKESSPGQERWVSEWQVVNTLVEYGQDGGQLYHAQPIRVGFANPSPGRTGILYLHPPSRQEPAVLTRQVKIAGSAPVLRIGVCANKDIDGDFVLRVKVDNKQLTEKVIAGAAGWQDLTFDLSAWRDKDVKIDIEAASNDWFYEYAFFDYIEIIDKAGQQTSTGPAEKPPAAPEPNQVKLPAPQAVASPVVTKPAPEPNVAKAAKVPEPQAVPSKPGELIFSDDFDSENSGRGNLHFRGFKNWFVTKGEVDLIGRGLKDAFPDHGLYIDLSGTVFTGAGKVAGALQSKAELELKQRTYILRFDLAVLSPRADAKLVVRLGEVFEQTIPLDGADTKFTAQSHRVSVPGPTKAKLVLAYQGTGTTNVLIDNITLTGDVGN